MKLTEIQRKLHQLLNEYEAAVIAENRGRNRSCYNEIENKYYQKRMELKEFVAELEAAQRWIPVSEPPKECEWKAYVPGLGAPTVNKRYLVKLINDWITIATYYLHVGGGYWKDDRGQELADGVVSLWKGLEE